MKAQNKYFLDNIIKSLNRIQYLIYIIVIILSTLINLLSTYILACIVNSIISSKIMPSKEIQVYVLLKISNMLLGYFMGLLNTKISLGSSHELAKILFLNIYETPYLNICNEKPEDINQTIINDADYITAFILFRSIEIINSLLTIVVCYFLIAYYITRASLLVFILMVSYILLYLLSNKNLLNRSKIATLSQIKLFSTSYRLMEKLKYIRNAGTADIAFKLWEKNFSLMKKSREKLVRAQSVYSICGNVIYSFFEISMLIWGSNMLIAGMITAGDLVAVLSYFTLLLQSCNSSLEFFKEIPNYMAAEQRLWKYAVLEKIEYGYEILEKCNEIVVENLKFSFPNNKRISVDVTFKPNNIYWLSGINGVGKTTLFNLILGLYGEHYVGNISYNQKSVKEIDLKNFVKNRTSIVEQSPYLIGENLEEILECSDSEKIANKFFQYHLDIQNIEEFIKEDSWETKLSGGEMQKLSIIKTLLSSGDVWLLDEPVSSLDISTREIFWNDIVKYKENRIIVIISHIEPNYYDIKINLK